MNYIAFTTGPLMGRQLQIKGTAMTFGRAHYNNVVLPDPLVSDEHCSVVRLRDGKWVLKDLGSQNGTFLNGRRITGETTLKSGDRIQIGKSTFSIKLEELASPQARQTPEPSPPAMSPSGQQAKPSTQQLRKGTKIDVSADVDDYIRKLTGKG